MGTGNLQQMREQMRASPFSPLARAVMDSFAEAVIVFDSDGRVAYTNGRGRGVLDTVGGTMGDEARTLMPVLARLGGRIAPLRVGALTVGDAAVGDLAHDPVAAPQDVWAPQGQARSLG
jgi:hypothetical protein